MQVSDRLDEVTAASGALADQEEPVRRTRLIDALSGLSTVLLSHLDYEEEHIAGRLRGWADWGWQ